VGSWDDEIPFSFAQQQYVATIPNAFVAPSESGTVFDWDRMFTLRHSSRRMFTPPPFETTQCVVQKYKKLTSIIQIYNSFGHFLSEQLPRLALIWDQLLRDSDLYILVPEMGTNFVKQVLVELLGIPESRLVFYRYGSAWNPCTVFYAEEFLMINPTVSGHPSRYMMDGLRKVLKSADPNIPSEDQRNLVVYMSRQDAQDRRVDNEPELITKIRENINGSELFVWDSATPLLETVRIMRRAKLVIGMHGQNLSPLVFTQPGTSVIELLHSNPWLHWWSVSSALRLDYWFVPIKGFTHESAVIPAPIDLTIQTVRAVLSSRS